MGARDIQRKGEPTRVQLKGKKESATFNGSLIILII
jgi:hypothetical protein